MKVEAQNLTIDNVLSKGKFIIPNFQREYDWDKDNIEDFLNDIEEADENENYFIGHMVFKGEFNRNSFDVIDGQQRITTITILLCCIRDKFINLGENNLAEAIHNKYIFSTDLDNLPFARLENKMPYPILQSRIQSLPNERNNDVQPQKEGERKILKTYEYLFERLNDYGVHELKGLRDRVLNLETIFVAATDLVDASTVFMTLNATGKDLTPLDLVKNYVFSKYPVQPHIDEPNDSWKFILENINELNKDNKKDKFLNNSFASRYKKVSDKKIYKEVVTQFKDGKIDAKKFILELKEDSKFYKIIINPKYEYFDKNDYDIYESINAIVRVFKIEVANSFLLSLLREYKKKYISKSMILRALNSIEHLHFINNAICSGRSSGYDKLYAKYAQNLYQSKNKEEKHKIIQQLEKDLQERIPDFENYKANFNKKVYYITTQTKQKSIVQYILTKLERKENKNVILINTSLEHIYPEKPKKEWGQLKNKENIKYIGNLVLLDSDLNSSIGNNIFSKKKDVVQKKSKIITTKKVFDAVSWAEDNIEKRTQDIIKIMYSEIWNKD